MASVTIDRIDGVRRDIADAVNRTAPGSTLPEPEQERLLAQACTETCALLTDWAGSPQWQDLRPERDGVLREALQDQEQFGALLGPLFGDAIERTLSGGGGAEERAERLNAARAEAERAVRGALASSRRYPRLRCAQLVETALDRVGKLRGEICALAGELGSARQEAGQSAASAARRAEQAAEGPLGPGEGRRVPADPLRVPDDVGGRSRPGGPRPVGVDRPGEGRDGP